MGFDFEVLHCYKAGSWRVPPCSDAVFRGGGWGRCIHIFDGYKKFDLRLRRLKEVILLDTTNTPKSALFIRSLDFCRFSLVIYLLFAIKCMLNMKLRETRSIKVLFTQSSLELFMCRSRCCLRPPKLWRWRNQLHSWTLCLSSHTSCSYSSGSWVQFSVAAKILLIVLIDEIVEIKVRDDHSAAWCSTSMRCSLRECLIWLLKLL